MSEYIKREDAERAIQEDIDTACMPYEWVEGMNDALDDLDGVPSADAVEVVRCKDCIFNNDGWCGADHLGSRWIESEDYCSFGERQEHE